MKMDRIGCAGIAPLRSATWSPTSSAATLVRRIRARHPLATDLIAITLSIYLSLTVRFDSLLGVDALAVFVPGALLPLVVHPFERGKISMRTGPSELVNVRK